MVDNIIYFDNYRIKIPFACVDKNGKKPFREWINSLSAELEEKIEAYIGRVAEGGSKKNIEAVGNGVFEIKINYGPGYRVYFGIDKEKMILLIGGEKNSQSKDIENAKKIWSYYEKIRKLQ